MQTVSDDRGSERRFIVCGDTPLAYRLVDELMVRYNGRVTVILKTTMDNWAQQISQMPDVEVVLADRLDEEAFRRAGLATATALGLVDQDDVSNVDAALIAREINPDVRVVIRMSNRNLGRRISDLVSNCETLSAAAIAAPAFVAAALDERSTAPIAIADRTVVAAPRQSVAPGDVCAGLAITEGRGEPEVLPAARCEDAADIVLAFTNRTATPPTRRRRRRLRTLSMFLSARLGLVIIGAFLLLGAGAGVLAWVRHITWAQAIYVAFLTELGGPFDADAGAGGVERVTLIILTMVSIGLIPALTAAVVDSAVKARLRLESGGPIDPVSDHMVVVGLGGVGSRVIRALHQAGIDVVAIERDAQTRGVQIARDLGIPVVIGDASRPENLTAASVETCRALLIASTDDVANLETALLGRTAKPDLRVIVRLFDGEFADRVQRAFSITASRSVSYLAAPAFAMAMMGRQILATIPVSRRVLLVAELPVGVGSTYDGRTVADADTEHRVRVLAVRSHADPDGPAHWSPPANRRLTPGDRIIAVTTRTGLGHLLTGTAATATEIDSKSSAPLPRPRPLTEGIDPHQPFGPADGSSPRPA